MVVVVFVMQCIFMQFTIFVVDLNYIIILLELVSSQFNKNRDFLFHFNMNHALCCVCLIADWSPT